VTSDICKNVGSKAKIFENITKVVGNWFLIFKTQ